MPEQFEDVTRWPVSRYFREVVTSQPAGRVLLITGKINFCAGVLIALVLVFVPSPARLAWLHVILFLSMPVLGFVWFVRASRTFKPLDPGGRPPWQRIVDAAFQLIPALLPWVVLVQSHVG